MGLLEMGRGGARLYLDLSGRLHQGRERWTVPGPPPAGDRLDELLIDSRIDRLIDESRLLAVPAGVIFLSDGCKDK